MSQEFFDPEIFGDFIIEAKEHLETIEPNLLELEKAPDNLSLLNEIFRPMHSLKGASGFLGLNLINGLAHKAENILDELRKGAMAITPEIMDVILSSTDALRQIIDNLESTNSEGDVDTGPIIETLDALLAGGTPPPAPPRAAAPVPAAEATEGSVEEAPAEAPAPKESPVAPSGDAPAPAGGRQSGDVPLWLETRTPLPPYTLTAFGEAHLRDFIEEAKDNLSNLSDGLLELEKHPGVPDLINDLFRYFHNLKGNSGIIGFQELNSLTHEAETLLNSVRKDEYPITPPLVDLLLLVVDVLEALIYRIDPGTVQVSPFDIGELLEKLRQAVAGGVVELPESLAATAPPASRDAEAPAEDPAPKAAPAQVPEQAAVVPSSGPDMDDVLMFQDTIRQQFNTIASALEGMRADGSNREFADAMFRSLTTIQNSCAFMRIEEIKVYAQRTAGIVDQGRSSGIDFSLMADLLEQECAIISDMLTPTIEDLLAAGAHPPAETPEPAKAPEPAPAPKTPEPAKPTPAPKTPEPAKAPPPPRPRARPRARRPAASPLPPSEWTTKSWTISWSLSAS